MINSMFKTYFNNDLGMCEKIMDWATSDDRCNSDAWHIHAEIITSNYQGQDWCWSRAIELWKDTDIIKVLEDFNHAFRGSYMNKETFHELLRSMFSDDQGTLNDLNIQILQEDEQSAFVKFYWGVA